MKVGIQNVFPAHQAYNDRELDINGALPDG